jgi:hypothetical protein
MAHPYKEAHQDKVSKRRVAKVAPSHNKTVDKRLYSEFGVPGGQTQHRVDKFARGGGVKGKKGHVHVNIVNLPHGAGTPPPTVGQTGTAGPVMPPPMGGGMAPPGGSPSLPGAAAPPGMAALPRKSGGRATYMAGQSNKGNLAKWAGYAKRGNLGGHPSGMNGMVPDKEPDGHKKQYWAKRNPKAMPTKMNLNQDGWSKGQGGTARTMGKGDWGAPGREAGTGSGMGLLENAKRTKKSYP